MLKRCNYDEVKRLKGEFPFYDFEDLTMIEGITYAVKAPDKYSHMRYGDVKLGNCSAADYYELEKSLLDFLSIVLDTIDEKTCTIIRYEPKWVVRVSESSELSLLLREGGIGSDVYGITTDKHDVVVKQFITASFQYNSFIQILFPGRKVIITPTDHMDLFFEIPLPIGSTNQVDLVLQVESTGTGLLSPGK